MASSSSQRLTPTGLGKTFDLDASFVNIKNLGNVNSDKYNLYHGLPNDNLLTKLVHFYVEIRGKSVHVGSYSHSISTFDSPRLKSLRHFCELMGLEIEAEVTRKLKLTKQGFKLIANSITDIQCLQWVKNRAHVIYTDGDYDGDVDVEEFWKEILTNLSKAFSKVATS